MKIAHLADTHIRNYERQDQYRKVFDHLYETLREEKPDYIVHCGDIAHKKTVISPEFVELCSDFFRNLESIAPTYIILGNHDGNLKNKDRQDALSPIVDALSLKNLHLLKESGETIVNDKLALNVLSIFDEENWVKPADDSKINIALYHGGILGSQTDVGWNIKVDHNVNVFDGFDFAFLGDIHKSNQIIDKDGRVRYPGSTIQQDHGETPDKGYLLWDIKDRDTFEVRHIILDDPNPHIDIVLTKTGKLPNKLSVRDGARIRIIAENKVSFSQQKKVTDIVRKRFNPNRITFHNKGISGLASVDEISEGIEIGNLRDASVQERLIREYLKDYNTTSEILDEVVSLNERFNAVINLDEEVARNVNWTADSLEWNNMFNYSTGNKVNLAALNGIVGILGKNYSGKSSIIDSLLFTLQNSTSKNSVKNVSIINQHRDSADSKLVVSVGSNEYTIERKMDKYVRKLKGKVTDEAKMALDFSVRNKLTEEIRSLNGETRNDTDANIRKIFGTKEDFMMTNFCSQMDSLQFINQGSTDRKKNLSKFLDLEVFEKKYRLAKEDSSDINGALKNYEGKRYEEEIEEEERNLIRVERDLENQKHECDILKGLISEANSSIKEIEIEIASQPKINLDIEEIRVALEHCEEEKRSLSHRSESASAGYEENTRFLDKVNLFFSENSYDDFCNKRELLKEKQDEMKSLLSLLEKSESRSNMLKADIERTSGVPCGDNYPGCKFLQNANDSKKELPDVQGELVNIGANLALVKDTIKDMDGESINRRLQNFRELIDKKSKYERQVADFILEKERISSSLKDVGNREKNLTSKREEYYKNERACELIASLNKQRVELVGDLEKLEKKMTSCEAKIYKRIEEKGISEQKMSHLKEAKQELANLRNQYTAFDLYKSCMDNNGISSDIIKKCLPIINDEVAKILVDIVPFEIFFEIEERKLEIYIRHPKHEPRLIEMASGAEKTIAAMAIRLALIKVGNLPTSDIFILDEPATALDAENMEGFIRILDMLKTQFKTVILISHLDILKECVDSEILIEKKKGFAYVDA